ncbi:hypothetical protein KPATCC21470_5672 [Kitasatospora purpeofusca]
MPGRTQSAGATRRSPGPPGRRPLRGTPHPGPVRAPTIPTSTHPEPTSQPTPLT